MFIDPVYTRARQTAGFFQNRLSQKVPSQFKDPQCILQFSHQIEVISKPLSKDYIQCHQIKFNLVSSTFNNYRFEKTGVLYSYHKNYRCANVCHFLKVDCPNKDITDPLCDDLFVDSFYDECKKVLPVADSIAICKLEYCLG